MCKHGYQKLQAKLGRNTIKKTIGKHYEITKTDLNKYVKYNNNLAGKKRRICVKTNQLKWKD